MKKIILGVVTLFLLTTAGYAEAPTDKVISESDLYLCDGVRSYEFIASPEELDHSPFWLNTNEDPPLSPQKALEAARTFLLSLSADPKSTACGKLDWGVLSITLLNYYNLGDSSHDKWLYKVRFSQNIFKSGAYDGPRQEFEVVVYMTGKVIEPRLVKRR